MAQKNGELHVVFVPYFTPSHMIPLVDIARLFASCGVKVSIITTHYNALLFESSINDSGQLIFVHKLKFPSDEVGLPEGIENFSAITGPEMVIGVFMGIDLLQKPIKDLIVELRPHCIVSDVCHTWTVDVAEQLKIPRLAFYSHSLMYHCVEHCLNVYTPHEKVSSDSESFMIPGLPDKIEMKRSQLPENIVKTNLEGPYWEMMKRIKEAEPRRYGVIHDAVYDLESTYAELYQKIKGKKPWLIGPLFHFSKREEANTAVKERHSCLSWLDYQEPSSVVYICFGSMVRFSDAQLTEIALALEASDSSFLWVVRKGDKLQENEQESWMPTGFKEKMLTNNKGLIVTGWVPQLKILNHPATRAFVTHCGWNSILESLTAGVPLLTWPLFAEQFYNEKLVEVLGCGVGVGAEVCHSTFDITDTIVKKEKIEASVKMLMSNSMESEKIRSRAKDIEAMVKRAVETGGSSYNHLTELIQELKCHVFSTLEE
ncbi:putative low-temperature-induced cysteine proteinase-like [Capsicum annuum]|uniref:nuatigenin 3-beta-glucosyltransferase n=1 Tax=Capsicum annuum TaxID=4072 RepID=UPI001FB0E90B|nr:nuatigenin 3-beta-glucosyltransferase [Capsicum annuum]KAF3655572.1 putative low-temperature-induced cysteine proteinase-like [Capsicum annuum]KAF3657812.1 putative low-temperature-induced cysteine proteinase-like [Capsicum annuum]